MHDGPMRLGGIRKQVDSYAINLQRKVIVDQVEKHVRYNGLLSDGDHLIEPMMGTTCRSTWPGRI